MCRQPSLHLSLFSLLTAQVFTVCSATITAPTDGSVVSDPIGLRATTSGSPALLKTVSAPAFTAGGAPALSSVHDRISASLLVNTTVTAAGAGGFSLCAKM